MCVDTDVTEKVTQLSKVCFRSHATLTTLSPPPYLSPAHTQSTISKADNGFVLILSLFSLCTGHGLERVSIGVLCQPRLIISRPDPFVGPWHRRAKDLDEWLKGRYSSFGGGTSADLQSTKSCVITDANGSFHIHILTSGGLCYLCIGYLDLCRLSGKLRIFVCANIRLIPARLPQI